MKRAIAAMTGVLFLLAGRGATAAEVTPPAPETLSEIVSERSQGFTVPIEATAPDQGSFTGQLRVVRFGVHQGRLVAVGMVTGTRVDGDGIVTSVARMVSIPVQTTTVARERGATPGTDGLECDILHLELGPLDLDLLGLVVHLNRIVLDIDAVPGAGNLLGNLLCAIVNLLNIPGSPLALIASLLNELLAILT